MINFQDKLNNLNTVLEETRIDLEEFCEKFFGDKKVKRETHFSHIVNTLLSPTTMLVSSPRMLIRDDTGISKIDRCENDLILIRTYINHLRMFEGYRTKELSKGDDAIGYPKFKNMQAYEYVPAAGAELSRDIDKYLKWEG